MGLKCKYMPSVVSPSAISRGEAIRKILREVCSDYRVNRAQLANRTRLREYVYARAALSRRLRQLDPPMSYPSIGSIINRDHANVIHLVRLAERLNLQ